MNISHKFYCRTIFFHLTKPSPDNEFLYCLRDRNARLFLKFLFCYYLPSISAYYSVWLSNSFYFDSSYFHFIYLCIKIAEEFSSVIQKPNLINCTGVWDFNCKTEDSAYPSIISKLFGLNLSLS